MLSKILIMSDAYIIMSKIIKLFLYVCISMYVCLSWIDSKTTLSNLWYIQIFITFSTQRHKQNHILDNISLLTKKENKKRRIICVHNFHKVIIYLFQICMAMIIFYIKTSFWGDIFCHVISSLFNYFNLMLIFVFCFFLT